MRGDRLLGLLMLFHVGFWLVFGQLSAVLGVAAPEILIVVLVPFASRVWAGLARLGLEPSTAAKFSLGFVLLAVSWLCLGVATEWNGAPGGGAVAVCVSVLALAGLCVGPASLHAIGALGGGDRGWLAAWGLGYVLGRAWGSWMELSAAGSELVEGCVIVGLGCVLAGVGLAFAWRPIAGSTKVGEPRTWVSPRLTRVVAQRAP